MPVVKVAVPQTKLPPIVKIGKTIFKVKKP
jgi:hypothetical protein